MITIIVHVRFDCLHSNNVNNARAKYDSKPGKRIKERNQERDFLEFRYVCWDLAAFITILHAFFHNFSSPSLAKDTGGFKTGVVMQLANMKVMLLCLSAISSFIIPISKSWLEGYILSLLIPIICFLTGLLWALCGQILSNAYKQHTRLFNIVFASSLIILAIKCTLRAFA